MKGSVVDFYAGKSVFITGGTGFLGITLVEKLLRSCPDLKNIYLLIRPKKGKEAKERLNEITNNSVFDILKRDERSNLFKKLIGVGGDVGEEHLGLSADDRLTIVERVNVVFHSAATLDFEADLKTTTNINLLGTRRVVEFCQEIRNLEAVIHVSSAYVNATISEAHEKLYSPPADVRDVLKKFERLTEEELVAQTPGILKDHPNPYTFTKNLAEHEVANSDLPAAIVRPSMIVGSWKEPIPGWTISKNGPQGFLMGASKGVVRRLPVAKHLIYDYIPVDIVVNCLIVAAFAVHRDEPTSVQIYHVTSSTSKAFKWDQVDDKINSYLHKYPLTSAVWYPHLKLLPSLTWFRISAFFVHMIPAYILDTVTRLSGGRPILVRLHTNVNKSLDRLEKFIFSEWKFHNPMMMDLHRSLSTQDQETFGLDLDAMNWEDYFVDLTKGVRVYLNKEPLKNLAKAKSKDKVLLAAHLFLQCVILFLVWWFTKSIFGSSFTKTGTIVPITYFLMNLL